MSACRRGSSPPCTLTLARRATDGSDKADIEKQKLVIARPLGKPIVLAPVNDLMGLALSEGIEDALTATSRPVSAHGLPAQPATRRPSSTSSPTTWNA